MRNEIQPPTEVIILDDAYQHRYVQAGLNILLMDYHRLIYFDKLLPAGRLREPVSGTGASRHHHHHEMSTLHHPHGPPRHYRVAPSVRNWQKCLLHHLLKYPDHIDDLGENPLLVTGIASPRQMIYDLQKLIPSLM